MQYNIYKLKDCLQKDTDIPMTLNKARIILRISEYNISLNTKIKYLNAHRYDYYQATELLKSVANYKTRNTPRSNTDPHIDKWEEDLNFNNKEEDMKKDDLVEVTTKTGKVFGAYIAEHSGEYIVSVDGKLTSCNKKDVEKVMPYTVSVSFLGDTRARSNPTTYQYKANKSDKLKKGDLVFMTEYRNFVMIEQLDTKSSNATVELKGWKVQQGPSLTN